MYVLLALLATALTSFLPILNKFLLRDMRPAQVAWAINAASLPLLAVGTLLLTQCKMMNHPGSAAVSSTTTLPNVDAIFLLALLGSALLNWMATLLSTVALAKADASLVSPLLTFNPAFTLLVAWPTLGEVPGLRQTIGVAVVLLGAYLLDVEEARTGALAPLQVLVQRPGTLLALIASALWGMTTVLEKLAIEHVTPPNGPLVALLGTVLLVALLTPGAFWSSRRTNASASRRTWGELRRHAATFVVAALIAGVAPLFGFTAIALDLVGYVTALFKLSAVLTILWAQLFLDEGNIRQRLFGAAVMVAGGILIAV